MQSIDTFTDLMHRVEADTDVVGAVLGGSHGKMGTATDLSDYDVHIVVRPPLASSTSWHTMRSRNLDLIVMDLDEFTGHALPGSDAEWNRYTFTHAPVLLDRLDGGIQRLVRRKGNLTSEEAGNLSRGALDAYINAAYRAAKNRRDGRMVEAHLDVAESLPPLLTALFALHGRVRPYNKYLRWEIDRHPLPEERWSTAILLPRLEAVLGWGDPAVQRELFLNIERIARVYGYGDVIDAWGDALRLLHSQV